MNERTKTVQQQVDSAAGQIAALGIACRAMLASHPDREGLALVIHNDLERMIAKLMQTQFSDEFINGMQAARKVYILKTPDDPGQPIRK